MLFYDTEILTHSLELSVCFSYACFIYAEIFEKMSSGGLEDSFSIFTSYSSYPFILILVV